MYGISVLWGHTTVSQNAPAGLLISISITTQRGAIKYWENTFCKHK